MASQAAVEYIIMFGMIIFFMAFIWGYVNYSSSDINAGIRVENAMLFINRLKQAADSVYIYGPPAKETINLYLPAGISNLEIINQREIFISIETPAGYSNFSVLARAPIVGSLPLTEGYYSITVEAVSDYVNLSY